MPRKAKYLVVTCVLLTLWVFFGPQPLGGRAAYVTTRGNSMEPLYSQGDLVVMQSSSSYGIGDVIAYKSGTLDTIVLHRIVQTEGEAFVTQGDNNDWLDPDRVRDAEVIGKAWFHVPGAGKLLAPLRNPAIAAGAAVVVGISFVLGGRQVSRRRRDRQRGERKSAGDVRGLPRIRLDNFTVAQKRSLMAVAGLALLSMLLLTVTLLRPPVRAVTSGAAYTHAGEFTYSAEVPTSTVYPDGEVSTGEPIFTRVVDRLTIGFDYRFTSEVDATINGYISLQARLVGQSGWTKPLLIGEPVPFGGKIAHIDGVLDLAEVDRITRRVQRVTGIAESNHSIELTPTINLEGRLAGQNVVEVFEPKVAYTLDAFQMKIASDGEAAEALSVAKPGSIKASQLAANNISLLGIQVPHGSARNGALLTLLVGLAAGVILWRRFSNPAHADEPAFIAAQYADWLVPVETMRRDPQRSVQVQGFDALLRLAELYERMILHASRDGSHSYFIEEEGVLYYYESSGSKKASDVLPKTPHYAPPPPPPPPLPRRLKETQDPERLRRLRDELKQIEEHADQPSSPEPDQP